MNKPEWLVRAEEEQKQLAERFKGLKQALAKSDLWATSAEGDCTKSADCPRGHYCKSGTCVPKDRAK